MENLVNKMTNKLIFKIKSYNKKSSKNIIYKET